MNYWETRKDGCQNPISKARYSVLVWEFSMRVRGISPNYLTVGIPYVENLIMSVTKGKISSSQSAFRKLERAIVMSPKFKNNILKEQAIKAFRTYEKKVGAIGKPGLWRRSYDILIKKEFVTHADSLFQIIINELEERFSILTQPTETDGLRLSDVEVAFEPLFEHYLKIKDDQNLIRILNVLESADRFKMKSCSAMEGIHWLEKLRDYEIISGLKEDAEKLATDIKNLGPTAIKE